MELATATDQEDCLSFHHFYGPVQLPELCALCSLPVGNYSPRTSDPVDPMPALMAHILAFPLLSLWEVKLTKPADSVTLSCYVKTSGFQKIILKVRN